MHGWKEISLRTAKPDKEITFETAHLWLAAIRAGAGSGQAEMEVILNLSCFGHFGEFCKAAGPRIDLTAKLEANSARPRLSSSQDDGSAPGGGELPRFDMEIGQLHWVGSNL